jgi:hypothetical protein
MPTVTPSRRSVSDVRAMRDDVVARWPDTADVLARWPRTYKAIAWWRLLCPRGAAGRISDGVWREMTIVAVRADYTNLAEADPVAVAHVVRICY